MGSARLILRNRDEMNRLMQALDIWELEGRYCMVFLSYPEAPVSSY